MKLFTFFPNIHHGQAAICHSWGALNPKYSTRTKIQSSLKGFLFWSAPLLVKYWSPIGKYFYFSSKMLDHSKS